MKFEVIGESEELNQKVKIAIEKKLEQKKQKHLKATLKMMNSNLMFYIDRVESNDGTEDDYKKLQDYIVTCQIALNKALAEICKIVSEDIYNVLVDFINYDSDSSKQLVIPTIKEIIRKLKSIK